MTDRELGSGKWKSGSGGGGGTPHRGDHAEDCSGQHSSQGYCIPENTAPARRGDVEVRRINRNSQAVTSLLHNHQQAVIRAMKGVSELGDAERADIDESLDGDLKAFPESVRDRLREEAGKITDAVSKGDRRSGWQVAFETGVSVAPDLPTTWRPHVASEDDIADVMAGIPR